MANTAFMSGHILCSDFEQRRRALNRINQLPEDSSNGEFGICRGIFHAPEDPSRAGPIITFGLSHKYLFEEIEDFLSFWEDLLSDIEAEELFIALEQEFIDSQQPFGKFYFLWRWETHPRRNDGGWAFHGLPASDDWQSRFERQMKG